MDPSAGSPFTVADWLPPIFPVSSYCRPPGLDPAYNQNSEDPVQVKVVVACSVELDCGEVITGATGASVAALYSSSIDCHEPCPAVSRYQSLTYTFDPSVGRLSTTKLVSLPIGLESTISLPPGEEPT